MRGEASAQAPDRDADVAAAVSRLVRTVPPDLSRARGGAAPRLRGAGVRRAGPGLARISRRVCLLSALAFASLGLLLSARPRTVEGVSGLMNLVMLPMWIFSGVFFSSSRFPDAVQPLIRALPLTAVIDALRGHDAARRRTGAAAARAGGDRRLAGRRAFCLPCGSSAGARPVTTITWEAYRPCLFPISKVCPCLAQLLACIRCRSRPPRDGMLGSDQPAAPTAQPAAAVRAAAAGAGGQPQRARARSAWVRRVLLRRRGAPVYLPQGSRRAPECRAGALALPAEAGDPSGSASGAARPVLVDRARELAGEDLAPDAPAPRRGLRRRRRSGQPGAVGVERGKGRPGAGRGGQNGAPASAASVEETEPVTFALAARATAPSLQGRVRPLTGGIQVNFPGFLCTLASAPTRGPAQLHHELTLHRCPGRHERNAYWQPLQSEEPAKIATEAEDPNYRAIPGCPADARLPPEPTHRARSTAAPARRRPGRVRQDREDPKPRPGGPHHHGQFPSRTRARPCRPDGQQGGQDDRLVERAVTAVCANTSLSGTNITQLCQDFVTAPVGSGRQRLPGIRGQQRHQRHPARNPVGWQRLQHYVFSPLATWKLRSAL